MRSRRLAVAACFTVLLAGCGAKKNAAAGPVAPPPPEGHRDKPSTPPGGCAGLKGIPSRDGKTCFVETHKITLTNGTTSKIVLLAAAAAAGNLVLSTVTAPFGLPDSVWIAYNGQFKGYIGAPFTVPGPNEAGKSVLQLVIKDSTACASVSQVLQCFDPAMKAVSCRGRAYP